MTGVDRQGREHGIDVLLELVDQVGAVVVVEPLPVGEHDAVLRQAGSHRLEEDLDLALDQLLYLGPHAPELLGGAVAVALGTEAGGVLVLEAGDTNLEELVEVLAEDGEELGPLEQRERLVLGQGEDSGVEVEP